MKSFSSWAQTSGVSENSAAYHEARQLLEFLKAGLMIDQLDCSNCLWAERVVRRYIEIQGAVRGNPKHPDFAGLFHGTAGSLDGSGWVRTTGYHDWLAEQQKIDGRQFKYAREHREEVAAEKRRPSIGGFGGGGAATCSGGGGGGKKKWKKGAGAEAPAPP